MRLVFAFAIVVALLATAVLWPDEPPRPTYLRIFCGANCPPCKQMDAAIQTGGLYDLVWKRHKVWKLEYENPKHAPLFEASGVNQFPTVILYDQHEGEISRIIGFPDKGGEERLTKFLNGTCGNCAGRGVIPINDRGRYNWQRCEKCSGKGRWK